MVNSIRIPRNQAYSLWEYARALPVSALDNSDLRSDIWECYAKGLRSLPYLSSVVDRLVWSVGSNDTSPGYAILDVISPEHAATSMGLKLATALCSLIGRPFRVIDAGELWQTVDVDVSVSPNRFRGVGYNPLHIDVVNSTQPPAYSALFCIRQDPAGGGHSLVSNLHKAVARLSLEQITCLEEKIFRDGSFYGMSGVGVELNPFPVLQKTDDPPWLVRFTAKMLPSMEAGKYKDAACALEQALIDLQEAFLLLPGQLLILNQRVVAHGREPLGPGQNALPRDKARYLRQTYMHASE